MTTRDTHHHGNLPEALIDWALAQARAGRLKQASLRQAARDIGVSPGAVYRHFDDRTSLLRAVTERGFVALAAAFEKAMPLNHQVADAAEAVARFRALGAAYLSFARDNYELWRLMFGPTAIPMGTPAGGPNAFVWLRQALVDLATRGVIAPPSPAAELYTWATIHGLSELSVSPAVALSLSEEAISSVMDRVLAGLSAP